jgi:hypothetical protein
MKTTRKLAWAIIPLVVSANLYADQVINDDLIITSSACIGFDCVNGESFGFDTLRLKENNLRIKFEDTSSSASFPSNDWQLTANDTSNGGQNKFSIDDTTSGRTPFTIEASAPSHSLYVDNGGNIGLGTNNPVVQMHVVDGNTPTMRLEQNGSSGFSAQTWDVAGNETNFFIRDATNGSTLPFRIKPGAPSNALYISELGRIGFGTTAPNSHLHVRSTTANLTNYLVELEDANPASEHVGSILLKNAGSNFITFQDTSAVPITSKWNIGSRSTGDIRITNAESPGEEFVLDQNGDLTITGTITATGSDFASSKYLKENFANIDSAKILTAISNLAITKWNYKKHSSTVQHIGPMAEDFHTAFGLNGNKTDKISVSDIAGVTLAAIQELKIQLDEKDKQIAELAYKIDQLSKQ